MGNLGGYLDLLSNLYCWISAIDCDTRTKEAICLYTDDLQTSLFNLIMLKHVVLSDSNPNV